MIQPARKYRPSNASEGHGFMAEYCDQCSVRGICRILPRVMGHNVDDPEYPEQWTYDAQGNPTCTGFRDRSEPRYRRPCRKTPDLFGSS